jgi:hypothetical protein
MVSRNRSAPIVAGMSIERTTSANSTVTCLYSAGVADTAFDRNSAPHLTQANGAIMRPTIGRSPAAASTIRGIRPLVERVFCHYADLVGLVSASALVGARDAPHDGRAQQPGRGVDE